MRQIEQVNIVISLDDGSVAIMGFLAVGRGSVLPAGAVWLEAGVWGRDPTDENVANEIFRAFVNGAQPLSWRRIEASELPERTYRNAWTDDGKAIVHDMDKARALHLDKLRRDRVGQLATLDVEWMKEAAQKNEAEADAIEAQRQALRDMPQRVDAALRAAETIEDLKRVA